MDLSTQSVVLQRVGWWADRGGHAHLLHSNIDWGQDLLLSEAVAGQASRGTTTRILLQRTLHRSSIAGIESSLPPVSPDYDGVRAGNTGGAGTVSGWYAMSVQRLIEQGDPHA